MTIATPRPLAPVSLRDLRDVDPYPAYEAMRAVGPVVWDEGMAAWLVLSHDGCATVERNEDVFEEPTGSLPGAAEIVGKRDIRSLVGAQHEALHRPLSHAWRPDPIAPLARGAVRPLVADRLASLATRDRFEVFEDLARLLPIAVIGRVLGLPEADTQTLDRAKGWMEAVLAWRHTYGEDPDIRAAAIEATQQLEPALIDTVRERRDRPADDAISFLWTQGREVAPDWGEQDVLDNAKFLFEGGSETTAFLISTATHRLLELRAADRDATLADRDSLVRFVEEVLRHSTVVHLRARRAIADTEIHGVPIAAGERVIAINAAANRDPSRWERPDGWTRIGHGCTAISPSTSGRATARVRTSPGWRRWRCSPRCGEPSRTWTAPRPKPGRTRPRWRRSGSCRARIGRSRYATRPLLQMSPGSGSSRAGSRAASRTAERPGRPTGAGTPAAIPPVSVGASRAGAPRSAAGRASRHRPRVAAR